MKNKIIIPTILFIVVSGFFFVLLLQAKDNNQLNNNNQNQMVLFYGDGCPHCEIVDKYIEENKIEEKISFSKKEVYNNQENQKELIEKAKICGISNNNIGVPFFWDGERCFIGDKDIINFFNMKTSQ